MGAPLLWNGNFAKFLKDQLNLFDAAYILTGTNDPTVVATNAPQGSLYLRVGVTGGTLYTKQDNGTTTNWTTAQAFDPNTIVVDLAGNVVTSGGNVVVS